MNKKYRLFLKNTAQALSGFVVNLALTITSVIRVLVLSKFSILLKSIGYRSFKTSKNCCVLGNGPSLKQAFKNNNLLTDNCDVFCVNAFYESDEFWIIKPRFYFIVDGQFFNPTTERTRKYVACAIEAFNKVDWEMNLCISSSSINGGILTNLNNPCIKILKWNTTTFEGFKSISHLFYRNFLAMPKCQTVINFALCAAVNMRYEHVYLYGADHSWTLDLRVDEDNVVCYGDRHVYNTNLDIIKKECTIGALLKAFANMFDAHWKIEEYSKTIGVKILNCTMGSFVDAYERYKF